jgi:hypothetical protein
MRPVVRVVCECGRIFAGDGGIARVVAGMHGDLNRLMNAVMAVGGQIERPALVTTKVREPGECPHFFGWLEIEPGDRSPTRGHTPLSSFKCANCNKTWPDCSLLLVAMKREIGKTWMAVKKLEARS